MKIKVTKNECILEEENIVNKGEYNITEVEFVFDEEYTNDLVKKAIFATESGAYEKIILNNKCTIPEEVLQQKGYVVIGVYAFKVKDETLDLRYSPKPFSKYIEDGSYTSNIINSEEITPTDKEQIEQAITDLQDGKVDKVEGKGLSTNDFTDEYKSQVDSNTIARHTHNNKTLLDGISNTDITNWNNKAEISDIPTKTSDLTNDNGFIDKTVNDLTNYTLKTNTGSLIDLEINQSTYVVTLKLKNQDGTVISTDTIDLPLESVVVGGSYDAVNKKIVLTLENGNTVDIPVGDLVAGLQTEITSQNKLASDLVDDSNSGNKFVTTSEKSSWNGKYDKPVGGIPSTDLDNSVQTSLGKADTAIQQHQDISGKEDKSNKVTSISIQSTDTQYPSALAVYNYVDTIVGDINTLLDTLNRTEV